MAEEAKVTLHWLNQSRSQRIVWLLEELKVNYDLEMYHRDKTTMLAPPELTKVHPLGKSPVVTVTAPGSTEPLVLAESGLITEYLTDHFPEGRRLVPQQWKAGMENKIGGETEGWMRYRYYLHYCEGSLMSLLVMSLVISRLKSDAVPFFIRPISSVIANRVFSSFIFPNAVKHFDMLEQQLATSPGGGDAPFLCGDKLTSADILMSFPLIAAKTRLDDMGPWEGGSWEAKHPRVKAYVERLEAQEGYKRSVKKVEEIEGEPMETTL